MIDLGDYIVSSDLVTEPFCCDLSSCKGACCVEGDSGAPLTIEEIELISENIDLITPYMKREGVEAVEQFGIFEVDEDGDFTTTLIEGKECAFTFEQDGITYCAIEKAFREGILPNIKPISCHLYPIRTKEFSNGMVGLNYHRWNICSSACIKGKKDGIKVYQGLKEPIIRAFGQELYNDLCCADKELNK